MSFLLKELFSLRIRFDRAGGVGPALDLAQILICDSYIYISFLFK